MDWYGIIWNLLGICWLMDGWYLLDMIYQYFLKISKCQGKSNGKYGSIWKTMGSCFSFISMSPSPFSKANRHPLPGVPTSGWTSGGSPIWSLSTAGSGDPEGPIFSNLDLLGPLGLQWRCCMHRCCRKPLLLGPTGSGIIIALASGK